MGCTEIRVYGLSPEAVNRLEGATEAVLDIPPEFSLRLSKDVQRLSIVNQLTTEGALGFSVPFTPTNDAVFIDFASPLTLDNRVRFYSVIVRVGNHPIRLNRLVVKGRNNRSRLWDLELRRSPDDWAELASQLRTNEIDFGEQYIAEEWILDNWTRPKFEGDFNNANSDEGFGVAKNFAVYFPIIDYGNWVDQSVPDQGDTAPVKRVAVEDTRPLLSLAFLLKKGFCQIGWTIDGVLFETEWFLRLWVYALRPDYYLAEGTRGGRVRGRRYDRFEWTGGGDPNSNRLRFSDLIKGFVPNPLPNDIDLVTDGWLCGIKNFQNVALQYKFTLKGEFTNEGASPFTAVFVVMEVSESDPDNQDITGEVLSSDSFVIEIAAGGTEQVLWETVVTLKPGQKGAIHMPVIVLHDFFVEPGLYFDVEPANKSFMTDDIVVIADAVSDQNVLLDWLKATMHLVNGRIETDWETKTITIYPNETSNVYGSTVPGFLLAEEEAEDISELIVANSITAKPVLPDQKRYYRLQFSESTDAYISSLNLPEPPFSRTLINDLDFPNEIEEDENPVFEPTLEGRPIGADGRPILASGSGGRDLSPFLPRLFDNTGAERSFNIGPRILFGFGMVRQINPTPINPTVDGYASLVFGTSIIEVFGYATQYRTWELDPTPAVDGSVIFGRDQQDLFVNFYLGLTQNLRGGTTLDVLQKVTMQDYVNENFRRLKSFKYDGIPHRVAPIGIRDFAPCLALSTPVTYFIKPAETECCDLPCGCQFEECEYYQDFGTFMRQDTLNDLKISSFLVDGIELLAAPVGFGDIKLVDIGGMTYVMNLVDTLNGIGAPYFSFNLSTRNHPEKGKRFFKIKRPVCVPFTIIISSFGDEIYKYTQAEQQTQWFTPGTWNDFGYGSELIGVPENCVTTTEY